MSESSQSPPPINYDLSLQERGRQLAAYSREVDRETMRDTCWTLGACIAWSTGGALAMGWSFASTDERWAPVVFWGALTASYTGISYALISAFRRHLERTGES